MAVSRSSWFAKQLLDWHATAGRHDLPWKKPLSAYRVWVSEIMLQQTQVTTVIPYFERFMDTFPTLEALAKAPLDQVLQHWSGLGYYARARHLHQSAKEIANNEARFPRTVEALICLPGIGRSTAGAILSQAFGIRAPILDGNVKRVLCRFHALKGWPGQKEIEHQLWTLAEKHTPSSTQVADYTQAIMDLGALCCTRRQPQCTQCPLVKRCMAFQHQTQHDFPTPKPKKTLSTRHVIMLLIFNPQGELLLQQRPLKGIWAGLWSLPEFKDHLSADIFLKALGTQKRSTLPLLKHSFTHFHLAISPQQVMLSKQLPAPPPFHWINEKALVGGFPAPIQKLIQTSIWSPHEHKHTSCILQKTTKKRARTKPPSLPRRTRTADL